VTRKAFAGETAADLPPVLRDYPGPVTRQGRGAPVCAVCERTVLGTFHALCWRCLDLANLDLSADEVTSVAETEA
jgi:hypothetical protein